MAKEQKPQLRLKGGRRIHFGDDYVISETAKPEDKGVHVVRDGVNYLLDGTFEDVAKHLEGVDIPAEQPAAPENDPESKTD